MRLTRQEIESIAVASRETLLPGSRVWLFGSRTDDRARGGDIDLLVDLPHAVAAADRVAQRQAFVARLYRLIGERRIDVVMTTPADAEVPAVVESARRQAIELVRP